MLHAAKKTGVCVCASGQVNPSRRGDQAVSQTDVYECVGVGVCVHVRAFVSVFGLCKERHISSLRLNDV